jgi:SAM-dependent methyltransferase
MFAPEGPTVRELAVQALSSVEHGYDLLAPKFDLTPFRTPDVILDAVARVLRPLGPFGHGLDLCCGTGAGLRVLTPVCRGRVTGVDISAGMLARGRAAWPSGDQESIPGAAPTGAAGLAGTVAQATWPTSAARQEPATPVVRPARPTLPLPAAPPPTAPHPARPSAQAPSLAHIDWVRADARALPFGPVFELVVSFGAFGHFLPRERPELFAQVRQVLKPGGRFVFPIAAPVGPGSPSYWMLLAFDTAMRVRNALWRPSFVMYYRTFPPAQVRRELGAAGFVVTLHALPELGRRADGSPRCGVIVATRPGGP